MTTSKRRGVSIYLASESPNLTETDFSRRGDGPTASVPMNDDDIVLALQGRLLVRDPAGFSLLHLWLKPNFPLPRHSHDTDCMYYVISGSLDMGNRTLRAGDSFFVPVDAPYQYMAGPDGVEVLEIRHGADHYETQILSDPDAYRRALVDSTRANRTRWAEGDVSPTFLENAGLELSSRGE